MGSRLSRIERHSTFSFLGEFQVANVLCGGAGQGRTVTGPKLGLGKLEKVKWGCSRDPGRKWLSVGGGRSGHFGHQSLKEALTETEGRRL